MLIFSEYKRIDNISYQKPCPPACVMGGSDVYVVSEIQAKFHIKRETGSPSSL